MLVSLVIRCDLPPKECSPNWRGHWAQRFKATKQARHAARILTVDARNRAYREWAPADYAHRRLKVSLTFVLPDNRKRDDDNLVASVKALLDGCADGLGVNDNQFEIVRLTRTVDRANPGVTIEVST